MSNQETIAHTDLPPLFKVLDKEGKSFHGGRMQYDLTTRTGRPGKWHEVAGGVDLCRNGLHVTPQDHISQWYGSRYDYSSPNSNRVFLVEVKGDAVVDGSNSHNWDMRDKYAVAALRLVEELTPTMVRHITQTQSLDAFTLKQQQNASLDYLQKNHKRAQKALWRMLPLDDMAPNEIRMLKRHLNPPTNQNAMEQRNEYEREFFKARKEYLEAWEREETEAQKQERIISDRVGRLTVTFVNCLTGTPDRLIGALMRHGKEAGARLVTGHDRVVRKAAAEAEATWTEHNTDFAALLARHAA
jgi:hypothetical protein